MKTRAIDLVDEQETLERLRSYLSTTNPDECWDWGGAIDNYSGGYGTFRIRCHSGVRTAKPHRVSWTILRGPIPPGLVIDHIICNNRRCCNPGHMRVVTQSENAARVAEQAPESCTKCGANDWIEESDGRRCRHCWNTYFKQWQRDQKPSVACPECDARFQRTKTNMRFCSDPCRRANTLRRRRDWARDKSAKLRALKSTGLPKAP